MLYLHLRGIFIMVITHWLPQILHEITLLVHHLCWSWYRLLLAPLGFRYRNGSRNPHCSVMLCRILIFWRDLFVVGLLSTSSSQFPLSKATDILRSVLASNSQISFHLPAMLYILFQRLVIILTLSSMVLTLIASPCLPSILSHHGT